MAILTQIPDGAAYGDIRATLNRLLVRVTALEAGTATPTPTPAPSVTAKPTIGTDGTPQVGETMTGGTGTYQNGSVASRAWLLNGSAISGATGASYVPQATGSLVYREVVTGTGGSINADSNPVTVAAAAGAKTTFPSSGSVVYEMAPENVSGVADGARVASVTDPTSSIAATAYGKGPVYKVSARNGKPGLVFNNDSDEGLTLGRPASVVNLLSQASGWSIIITFNSATGPSGADNSAMFGTKYGNFWAAAGSARAYVNGTLGVSFNTASPANDMHTLILVGDRTSAVRMFLDGTMVYGGNGWAGIGGEDLRIGALFVNGPFQGFGGTIYNIRVVNTDWTAPECLQAHFWACTRYGKTLPIAGRSWFPVFDGDSIMEGVGANADTCMPQAFANMRGIPFGGFAQTGKPSAGTAPGDKNGYNISDCAPRDVDGFADVTGLPVVLLSLEYYNQMLSGISAADGVAGADRNRAYATARKATGKFVKQFIYNAMSCDKEGDGFDAYSASFRTNLGNFDYLIDVAANATLGGRNQYQNTTYFDGHVHPAAGGYAIMAQMTDTALTNAGFAG